MLCWKCGKQIGDVKVYRETVCSECGAYLHCCKGCDMYDRGAPYECREHIEENIVNKERANFCDYYKVGGHYIPDSDAHIKEAKEAFSALFKF